MSEKMKTQGITLRLSWPVIVILLLITNLLSVYLWKPWQDTSTSTRKITMSGEATIKAEPDEYVINPYFEFTNADKSKATEELASQSAMITAKLKELGVTDEQIKTNSSNYDKYYGAPSQDVTSTLQLQYTVTVNNKEIAQKAQDYLLTLNPKGQVSPVAQFSEAKRKELEAEAREKAIDDAKAKADKTAAQLKAKIGKVVAVSDGAGYGAVPMPYAASGMEARDASVSSAPSLPIQAGQNEFRYSVTVEYELK